MKIIYKPDTRETVLKYQNLCKIARALSTHGMNVFLEHIATCKKCGKRLTKHKK